VGSSRLQGMAKLLLTRLGAWGAAPLQLAQDTGDSDGPVRAVDDTLEADAGE
jgi:hypothetical protein